MEQIKLLEKALKIEGISILPEMIDQFSKYRELLVLWNQKINLISRKDENRIISRHFLGSLR
ncbi:class I SAM-dependent methyltransferase, partial [bacterium]|nr:class I SAM-dependent methyltransferase [bacterium]